eukprot:TRINITY_DN41593_c0_g1_i1.p1 TRINITY_DN41593_c0_g1~~TRINITY_DN41593_c0_g1_i1.p1  ORF type:complete len:547 (-),score=82.51 TRINITY_DN41593_c0_g1_i1:281-1921(-)
MITLVDGISNEENVVTVLKSRTKINTFEPMQYTTKDQIKQIKDNVVGQIMRDHGEYKFELIGNERDVQVGGKTPSKNQKIILRAGDVITLGQDLQYIVKKRVFQIDDSLEAELEEDTTAVKAAGFWGQTWQGRTLHLVVSLGTLYAANLSLKNLFANMGWKFPAPLAGMFVIIGGLLSLPEPAADRCVQAFTPALNWIQRWLPLFYVPSLVTLPLAIRGIAASEMAKIGGILAIGMPASLLFTAQAAVVIRNIVNTPTQPTKPSPPLAPFNVYHYVVTGVVAAASLIAAASSPDLVEVMHIPFLLAATVGGYLAGQALPVQAKAIVHPIITCGLLADLGALIYGQITGVGFDRALQMYLTKGANGQPLGAGDILMSFLGVVILSFGFKIYQQKALMKRHAPEIFGSTLMSAAFSMFATAAVARFAGLSSGLSRAIVPRSVTVALALPIAQQLEATELSITASAVVITGLIGANFAQTLLDIFGFKDPIVRGLSTAGSAHGLGTAALAAKEPDALPFCALAYALIGVLSTLLSSLPFVAAALVKITG